MANSDSLTSTQPALIRSLDLRQLAKLAFISDVHLQAAEPDNFAAWAGYLSQLQADALFILGDLFEVWIGDDVLGDPQASFERDCLSQIHAVSQRMPVYWMAGNRDFLLGSAACQAAGMQALQDPCELHTADGVWLLSHGDAWCLQDTDYQLFRQTVRSAEWQTGFLAKPLPDRLQQARQMRAHSESLKATQTVWADVDTRAAIDGLIQHQATVLLHGHTHRPADHLLGQGLMRYVLSDWDAAASPPRLQAFTWQAGVGFARTSLADQT
jgi:UDP-2,3-diacylglucosamine hydrolase